MLSSWQSSFESKNWNWPVLFEIRFCTLHTTGLNRPNLISSVVYSY